MAVKNIEDAKQANSNAVVETPAKAEINADTVMDSTIWDEVRLEDAQRRLKEMYIQVSLYNQS